MNKIMLIWKNVHCVLMGLSACLGESSPSLGIPKPRLKVHKFIIQIPILGGQISLPILSPYPFSYVVK